MLFFSCGGTPNVASVIPVMDHLDKHLTLAAISPKYDPAIRAAVAMGKKTLNHYYDCTDHSELYHIAIGIYKFMCLCQLLIQLWKSALHPCHKLYYFQCMGWMAKWIATMKKIIQDKFNHSYCF